MGLLETPALKRRSYDAAHKHVGNVRGPASEHLCVDCEAGASGDVIAAQWSYNHCDPREEVVEEGRRAGVRYSLDPDYYDPRCGPCHRLYDKEHARRRAGKPMRVPDGMEARYGFAMEAEFDLRRWLRCVVDGLPDRPFDDVRDLLGAVVYTPNPCDLDLVTLYVAGCHLAYVGLGVYCPRLRITAPSAGAGKSTLARLIAELSAGGKMFGNTITAANVVRQAQHREVGFSVFVFDEADKTVKMSDERFAAIINSSWRRGELASFTERVGDGWAPVEVDVFSGMVFCGNGVDLPPDVEQRTFDIRTARKEGFSGLDEDAESALFFGDSPRAHELRKRCAVWAESVGRVSFPGDVREWMTEGRDRQRWGLLLMAGDAMGGRWPRVARELARADCERRAADVEARGLSEPEQLLRDLYEVVPTEKFGGKFVGTLEMVGYLVAHDPERYGTGGCSLSGKTLVRILRQHYEMPEPTRRIVNGRKVSGFLVEQLTAAWRKFGVMLE